MRRLWPAPHPVQVLLEGSRPKFYGKFSIFPSLVNTGLLKMNTSKRTDLTPDMKRILEARHHDPFSVLGRHARGKRVQVTVFLPDAKEVCIEEISTPLSRVANTDFFDAFPVCSVCRIP